MHSMPMQARRRHIARRRSLTPTRNAPLLSLVSALLLGWNF
jgi:hypothetical protein